MVPTEKDGLVVYLGSTANFSEQLKDLDRETGPLRSFPDCPRNFKKTSVERHFQEKGFTVDWCAFRLLKVDGQGDYSERGVNTSRVENSEQPPIRDQTSSHAPMLHNRFKDHVFLKRSEVPMRHITTEFMISIIPICALFLVIGVMFCGLFCSSKNSSSVNECEAEERTDQEWEGFVESFFLVIKDIVTCCSKKKDSEEQLLQADSSRTDRRASSVNRQTDSLRYFLRSVFCHLLKALMCQ